MKRLLLSMIVLISINSFAQKIPGKNNRPVENQSLNTNQPAGTNPRCGTDLLIQQSISKHPSYQQSIRLANDRLNDEVKKRIAGGLQRRNMAESALPITIPVVIHIVLPNPSDVTDAMIQYQLDKLNTDFSGLNADSTNLVPMYPYSLRGHSGMRFELAKRSPRNSMSTGIERRCSNIVFTAESRDPIKIAAEGGLDAWDPDKYLNIWVGNTNEPGLLGYSTYPYSTAGYDEPPAIFHGVTIKQQAFANTTTLYAFNRGRTLVHEMGHFFGLFHIFQGACADEDFSLAAFDAGNIDDTPPQAAGTGYGAAGENACPSGSVNSGCTANAASRLYQNFMDYTDDPCMSMFTRNQVTRMETALDLFKPGLKSSNGATAPPVFAKDIEVLATIGPNTGNPEFMDCNSTISNLSFCSDRSEVIINPKLVIRNNGATSISSLQVWYSIGTATAELNLEMQFSTPLTSGAVATLPLNPIALKGSAHELRIFVMNPDNMIDEYTLNDTLLLPVTIDVPTTRSFSEGFEDTVFAPEGWKVINNDNDNYSWQRIDGIGKSGQAAVFINFFDYDRPGRVDDLVSPTIDVAFADSIVLDFQRAYRLFDMSVQDFSDTLEILVSEDCGQQYRSVWKKGGAALASLGGETGLYNWYPTASEWLNTSLNLRPLVSKTASTLKIIFRAKNGYGQNLFLDDINLRTVVNAIRDAGIASVEKPLSRSCNSTFTPSLMIENLGEDTLRKLTVGYAIDGGALQTIQWNGQLRKFQQQLVAFDEVTLSAKGLHEIQFFIHSPNDLQDENPKNDTVRWRLMVFDVVNAPVKEGFESAIFPPADWEISGATADFKWERITGAASERSASAWVNNRINTNNGSREELYSPIIRVDVLDSLLVLFDVAHVTENFPSDGSPTDTLQVFITTDCGASFIPVYKKWGSNLNTLKEAYPGPSTRDTIGFMPNLPSHWRTDSINITKALGASKQFQLVFRNINNNDNNIFLDNIRVNPVILPTVLKEKGFQLMPNPTTGVFYIRHYLPPLNLEGIQIVNTRGQTILVRRYKGNALATIPIDLTGQAAGIYTIRLMYKDRSITEKIIKTK